MEYGEEKNGKKKKNEKKETDRKGVAALDQER